MFEGGGRVGKKILFFFLLGGGGGATKNSGREQLKIFRNNHAAI